MSHTLVCEVLNELAVSQARHQARRQLEKEKAVDVLYEYERQLAKKRLAKAHSRKQKKNSSQRKSKNFASQSWRFHAVYSCVASYVKQLQIALYRRCRANQSSDTRIKPPTFYEMAHNELLRLNELALILWRIHAWCIIVFFFSVDQQILGDIKSFIRRIMIIWIFFESAHCFRFSDVNAEFEVIYRDNGT